MTRTSLVALTLLAACSETVTDDQLGFTGPDAGQADAAADAADIEPVGLVINEVAAAGDPDDWFELYNGSSTRIDISGYGFTDDPAQPLRAQFAPGTTIQPGQYYVLYLTDDIGFGLGAEEEIVVSHPNGLIVDRAAWLDGESPADSSFARTPDATGGFATTAVPTPGSRN